MKLPTITPKLKSRKFWITILFAAIPPLLAAFVEGGDIHEAMKASAVVVCTYLASQGLVDSRWIPAALQEPQLEDSSDQEGDG